MEVNHRYITLPTGNQAFDEDGYLYVPDIIDITPLVQEVPEANDDNADNVQVFGSIARYNEKVYRAAHTEIRLKIEKILGKPLYNTYQFDRFYFPGQELPIHHDRPPCEISVTVHIGTNIPGDHGLWPIFFEKSEFEEVGCVLRPGDGCIYKGCDIDHWRNPLTTPFQDVYKGKTDEKYYYHQVFFHYVLQDGYRSHYNNDASKAMSPINN